MEKPVFRCAEYATFFYLDPDTVFVDRKLPMTEYADKCVPFHPYELTPAERATGAGSGLFI